MSTNNNEQLFPTVSSVLAGDLVPIIRTASFSAATDGQWYARADQLAPGISSIAASGVLDATPNPITGAGTIFHKPSALTAGPYGDATHYVTFTTDQYGHLIATGAVALTSFGFVVGPSGATDGNFAYFDGATGKLIKNGGTPGALAVLSTVDAAHLDQSSLPAGMTNGTFVESHATGAATFALKTYAGTDPTAADPVKFVFRSVTPGSAAVSVLSIGGALSLAISSGSTLGTSNATPFKLWLVAFNDGGAVRIGVMNALSGANIYPVGKSPIDSSTAEGGLGAADSALTFYTGVAVTGKAYVVLGYASYESGLTTAGTWDASPTVMQRYTPNIPLPGEVVQVRRNSTGAAATGTTVIPFDDTIPQITEGDQYMSQAITPTSAANLLEISMQGGFASTAGSSNMVMALFQDATANALAAQNGLQPASGNAVGTPLAILHTMLAGTTSSTTMRMRAGANTASTTTFNGFSGGRILGGILNSYIQVKEIAA